MQTPVRGDYGLGLQVTSFYDHRVVDHTGEIGGFAAHVAFYPEDRLFVAVLGNVEDEPVKATACDLAALVFGSQPAVLDRHPLRDGDLSWMDLVTGTCAGQEGEPRTVARDGERLSFRRGSTSYSLIPIGFRVFGVDGSPGLTLTFEGPAGRAAVSCTARSCGRVLFSGKRRAGE